MKGCHCVGFVLLACLALPWNAGRWSEGQVTFKCYMNTVMTMPLSFGYARPIPS